MDDQMIVQYPNLEIEMPEMPWARRHLRNLELAHDLNFDMMKEDNMLPDENPNMVGMIKETGELIELGYMKIARLVVITAVHPDESELMVSVMDQEEFVAELMPHIELIGAI
jgi:hypothetical protein